MMYFDTEIVLAVIAGMVVQGAVQFLLRRFSEKKLITKLKEEVEELQDKVTLLESGHQDAPIPIWLKDGFGIMLALNKSYEDTFLIPRGYSRKDYLHKGDEKVWPEDIANEYRKNDLMVFRTGKTWIGYETIVDHQGREEQWRIIKYPRFAGGVKIGIAGMAIPPA